MKTFQEICNEVASAYKSDNYRRDFEYGIGVSKFTNEENFFTIAAERYANYKAEIAHDDACTAQLQLISDTFRENAHKGDKQSDIDVFEAIADTIKTHPQL